MTKQMGSQASTLQASIPAMPAPMPHSRPVATPKSSAENESSASAEPPPLYRPVIQIELTQLEIAIAQLHQQVQAIAQANRTKS